MRFAPCVTLFLAIGLGACGGKPEPAAGKPAGPPATLITTTTAESITLDVTEDSLGTLEALIDPKIGAEVAGRVIAVHAKAGDRVRQGQPLAEIDPTDFHIQGQADAAEIARLDALVAQAERFAERQQRLVAQGFISKNGADDALAQRDAARAQLATARARSGASRYNLGRSKVVAPVEGVIETQIVAAGDYVKVGDPLYRLVSNRILKAHLPYPESAAARIRPGQADAAEIARLDALVAQAERFAERQQRLVAQGFISKNGADDALAQRDAARAQLATARARSGASRYNLGRSKVVAPVEGVIETQIVAAGDYVKVGDPLYRLVSNRILKAHLPYPESAAARIRPGQPVRLTSPQQPDRVIEGSVEQVKPTVSEGSRALDVQVRLDNDGGLRAGGTVNGAIVTGRKPAAVVVPEQSVVLRPAGKVVYVVAEGKARQRIVEPGVKRDGRIEIVKGLAPGEVVAEDGAGFLSDGAAVTVKAAPETRPATAAARP